jgi:hypothetical protein
MGDNETELVGLCLRGGFCLGPFRPVPFRIPPPLSTAVVAVAVAALVVVGCGSVPCGLGRAAAAAAEVASTVADGIKDEDGAVVAAVPLAPADTELCSDPPPPPPPVVALGRTE